MKAKLTSAKGKVLSFRQDGEFYFRSGLAKMDKNDYIGAMASYRMALELEPQNVDAALGLAEALTAMNRPDESNRFMLVHFRDKDTCPPEAYFGMGCNFMALREYEQAIMSFDRYLELDPEGRFAYEAYDMAEALSEEAEQGNLVETERERLRLDAEMGRKLMEQDDFEGAISVLEEVIQKDPLLTYARNNLALAYYCVRDYDRATEQVGIVLKSDPHNLQANCNLAVFLKGAKDEEGLKKQLEYLKSATASNEDDLNHLGVTLMELREFGAARNIFRQLSQKRPYEAGVLHRYALTGYYTGDFKLALNCYDKLLQIDKNDSIARYYRSVCQNAIKGETKRMQPMLNYQVPIDEMVSRLAALSEYIHAPREELKKGWFPGSDVQNLVKWGLTLSDQTVKRAMLRLIASFGDNAAETMLRDFALQREQNVDLKREAFALLKGMGAEEPYLSYMNGALVESRVNLVPARPKGMPECYSEALQQCLGAMQGERKNESMTCAIGIWSGFITRMKGFKPLNPQQTAALAGALEYTACKETGEKVTKLEICNKYGITAARLNGALTRLKKDERE